jgi:hypothetical protein
MLLQVLQKWKKNFKALLKQLMILMMQMLLKGDWLGIGDGGVLNLNQLISWLEKENLRRKRLLCKLKHERDNNLLSNCKWIRNIGSFSLDNKYVV